MKNTMKIDLSEDEKIIEENADVLTKVNNKKKARIDKIISETKKNKSISLRITNYDLVKLKEKAELEGLPYQTLITNILHKYISNQLYEKEEMLKSIQLLKEKRAI